MNDVKSVLVTGNLGYIGTVLTSMLITRGYNVTGLDAGYFIGKHLVPQKQDHFQQFIRDVRDVHQSELRGYDAVIHLAGLSNDPLGDLDPRLTDEINHKASVRLGVLAKAAGVKRFVFSSSCSAYGVSGDAPVTEDAGFNPVSAYAKSKIDAEKGLAALSSESFAPIFLRNATVYGLSPRQRFDLVVNNLSGCAHTTGSIKLLSDGTAWRPIIHVEDVSLAFINALEAPFDVVNNQAFNIGLDSENYTVKQIAEAVHGSYANAQIEILGKSNPDARSYKVDFGKAKHVLGFSGVWNLEKGCDQLWQTFHNIHLTEELFNDEYFVTLKRMKNLLDSGAIAADLRWTKQPWSMV